MDPAEMCRAASERFLDDPPGALALFEEAARAGYPNAFFGIAEMRMSGLMGEPDPRAAEELYRVAAEAGHPPSMYRLGMLFSGAGGHEEDPAECRAWFEKAAEAGMAEALPELSDIYMCGYGGPADEKRAVETCRRSHEAGNALSTFKLACMLSDGVGGEKDEAEAVRLFRIAAYKGVPEAQFKMGLLAQEGRAESDLPAAEWYRRASDAGLAAAKLNLATLHYKGEGVEKDLERAFVLYSEAAEAEDCDAQFMVGRMLVEGIGTARDPEKGLHMLRRAASNGSALAAELAEVMMRRQNTQIVRIDGTERRVPRHG